MRSRGGPNQLECSGFALEASLNVKLSVCLNVWALGCRLEGLGSGRGLRSSLRVLQKFDMCGARHWALSDRDDVGHGSSGGMDLDEACLAQVGAKFLTAVRRARDAGRNEQVA